MQQTVFSAAVRRLPIYLDIAQALKAEGASLASSAVIAAKCGVSSSRVRDDLGGLGIWASDRRGYALDRLIAELRAALGMDRGLRVLILGTGGIGHALAQSGFFVRCGLRLVAELSLSPDAGAPASLRALLPALRPDIAVLNDRRAASDELLALLEESGVSALWDLTGGNAGSAGGGRMAVENACLADSLLCLSGTLAAREDKKANTGGAASAARKVRKA